ncbi:MAG: hypothetical protein H6948_02155 [Zoogloeaceae bacterium]|nr:hypothetical protein [Zoogloeaceae bacterium]
MKERRIEPVAERDLGGHKMVVAMIAQVTDEDRVQAAVGVDHYYLGSASVCLPAHPVQWPPVLEQRIGLPVRLHLERYGASHEEAAATWAEVRAWIVSRAHQALRDVPKFAKGFAAEVRAGRVAA